MNFSTNEKELTSILAQAKEQLRAVDREIVDTESSASEIAEDLDKLKTSLKAVDSELNVRLQRMAHGEENHEEIRLFYEKIVENTKNLTLFINRQNSALENGG